MNLKLKRHNQSGFTLIELLVALAILSILALLAVNAFDGARSKAQAMISLSKQVGDANIALKTDTGCYVNKPAALFDETTALVAGNNYCNRNFGRSWARSYLGRQEFDATNGNLKINKIASEVTVSFGRDAVGLGRVYYIRTDNVPNDIIRQALIECNGTDEGTFAFPANKCRATLSASGGETGTFDMQYDESR